MKVRVDYTVEVDAEVIQKLIDDYGTDETVTEFVRSYLGNVAPLMDETIESSVGIAHTTMVVKSNFGVGM